jgi:hypothetical protein
MAYFLAGVLKHDFFSIFASIAACFALFVSHVDLFEAENIACNVVPVTHSRQADG